jgi:hypothetical protein
MSSDQATRRGFLSGFMLAVGGATASAALSACGGVPDGTQYGAGDLASYQRQLTVAPAEIVPLRPGVTYDNVMPSHVPMVRWPGQTVARVQNATLGHKQ